VPGVHGLQAPHRPRRPALNLIPETRALLREAGVPYVIENVPGAPLENPITLCGSMFGLDVKRHRIFECSFPVVAASVQPRGLDGAVPGRHEPRAEQPKDGRGRRLPHPGRNAARGDGGRAARVASEALADGAARVRGMARTAGEDSHHDATESSMITQPWNGVAGAILGLALGYGLVVPLIRWRMRRASESNGDPGGG
jgi:hypothetical protein